ncbi:MAG: response regulator [Planctomycetota bacterium]
MAPGSPLSDRRILVVEDNFVLAESMRFALEEFGCTVVGPAPTSERALQLLAREAVDGAVLDIDLQGKSSAPVAEELTRRQTPFVFLTGYESAALLPEKFHSWTRLSKPVDPEELARVLAHEIAHAPR